MDIASATQRVILDAMLDHSVIRGTLTAPTGERREFHGWLELNTMLEAILGTADPLSGEQRGRPGLRSEASRSPPCRALATTVTRGNPGRHEQQLKQRASKQAVAEAHPGISLRLNALASSGPRLTRQTPPPGGTDMGKDRAA